MSKHSGRYVFSLSLLAIPLVLLSCSGREEESTRKFVVLDRPSGAVVSAYEYDKHSDVLLRATSYGANERALKITDYFYDSEGELRQTITQKSAKPQSTTTITNYQTRKVYDDAGRLSRTVQTTDDGAVVETYYGYDDTGELRGVVQKSGDDSLLMKDY